MNATLSRYVRPAKFEEATGYTPKAVEVKIARSVWLEGYEFIRAPDGNILVDMQGYETWAEGRRVVGSIQRVTGSK